MHPLGTPAGPPDWYPVLNLAPDASTEEIAAAVERMSRQATALSVTAPDRSRLLRDQIRAIRQDLLSGDARRQRYDQARAAGTAGPPASAAPAGPAWQAPFQGRQGQGIGQQAAQFAGLVSRVAKFLQTGWTCANCGHGALPNDKFCHKCGSKIEAPAIAQQSPRVAGQQPGVQAAAPAGQQAGFPAVLSGQQADQPQPTFCGKCGGSIAPGNTFCTQCGAQRA